MSDFLGGLVDVASKFITPQTVSAIGGALIGANANDTASQAVAAGNQQAAQTAADSGKAARDEFRAAAARGVGDITQGTNDFASTIAPVIGQQAIVLPTDRGLTQQQQIGLADQQRNEGATLAASGLRGAGRAGVAAVMDADSRYIAQAHDQNDADTRAALRQNQGVQTAARTGLAQIYAQAGAAKANTEIGAGNQIGSSVQQQGNTQAGYQSNTGLNNGAAALGAGSVAGKSLGSLASIYANPTSPTDPTSNYSGGTGELKVPYYGNSPNSAPAYGASTQPPSDTGWQDV